MNGGRLAIAAAGAAAGVLGHEALLRYCVEADLAAGLLAGRIADGRGALVLVLVLVRIALFVALPALAAGTLIHLACLPRNRSASPPR